MKKIDTSVTPTKRTLQKKAFAMFSKCKFKESFMLYEMAFWLDTSDLDSIIGMYLSDIGIEFPDDAIGIFDAYQVSLKTKPRSEKYFTQKTILKLIQAFDKKNNAITNNHRKFIEMYETHYESHDAISFRDIQELLKTISFKEIYTSVIIKSKLIFSEKNEFYEFLNLLIKNGFPEASMTYIDALPQYDLDIIPIIEEAMSKIQTKAKKRKKKNG